MDGRFIIRSCTAEDIDSLWELEKICFDTDSWSRGFFENIQKDSSYILLCVQDLQMAKIVGYSVFYGAFDQGDLANIAVLPDCRGLGIGKALLEETMKKAFDTGVSQVFLEVRESNSAARGLYLSSGFAEIGKRRNYYNSPREDAILLMRELGSSNL